MSRRSQRARSTRKTALTAAISTLSMTKMVVAQENAVYPSPTDIAGTGPRPPAITQAAEVGSWQPPSDSSGLPPPSLTGMGRQAQIIGPDNFCLFMPPDPVNENLVDAEADAVAYCVQPRNDTRPFPDGFILTSHYRNTSDYVQVSGTYDWRKMNINPYDSGGEYDNHGPAGVGNPVGAHIDGGQDFFQFMGAGDLPGYGSFVIRSCFGPNSYPYCRNTYDLMGGLFVAPGDYTEEGFTSCQADADLPPGVYSIGGSLSTFAQGQSSTPAPATAPSSSMCSTTNSPSASGVTYTWLQTGYALNQIEAAATGSASAASPSSSSVTTSGASSASSRSASGSASSSAPAASGSRSPSSSAVRHSAYDGGVALALAWGAVIAAAVGIGAGVGFD